MTTWLRANGKRHCPVAAFVSPGSSWLKPGLNAVPTMIALRITKAVADVGALAVEFEGGAVWRLRSCFVQDRGAGHWDLIGELEPP